VVGFCKCQAVVGFATSSVDMKVRSDEWPIQGRLNGADELVFKHEGRLRVVAQVEGDGDKLPET
jgi:hypothetical protein